MDNRQFGRFKISMEIVEQHPEAVAKALAMIKCVPVRVEAMYAQRAFEYTAISDRFDVVAHGVTVPEYRMEVKTGADGELESVDMKRVED